ncbi:hypothetical protein [Dyadobacter sp. Leaf189]|uniref:hypothetical protein n=1 Tax=Dyadobacter sp. Leaf189 TaxID=1736295 RepID=UPI0006FF1809|nr:hypothetical protein [Dyadobacter sp. Leaf189]KQS32915.1 hypothetical protein ASG33_02110 [Dyadobacter sp. Leaf189]
MKLHIAPLILIITVLESYASAQPAPLKGTWLSPLQELIEIHHLGRDSSNVLANKLLQEDYFHLFIFGDTLSYQHIYTSSETDFKIEYTDRYDLKIVSSNDSTLIVEPVSKLSKSYFQNRALLKLSRKEHLIDTTIVFEKLTYHATPAWFSPTVTVKLDNRKNLALDITNDYPPGNGELPTGNYTAVLDDSTYRQFIEILQKSSIRSLKFGTQMVKDSPEITLDIYFNGQRKYLKATDVPKLASDLLSFISRRLQAYPGLRSIDTTDLPLKH